MKKAKKSEEDFDAKSAKSSAKNAKASSGGSRVSASAGEDGGNVRVERVERVERNSRVEHREHKELGEPWPKAKLGEVCEEKVKRIRTLAPKTTIAYIDIGSVCRERKRILTTTQYSVEDAPGRAQQLVQKGDLLVSTVRPKLNAVALVEEDSDLPLVASTGFCVLRAKSGLDSRYAYYFSQTEAFISQLVPVSEKASYPSVTDTVVKGAEILLPPLSVQRAVVARLEGEMKAVERLEAGFREMGAAAEAAFAAELAEAFAAGAGAGEERNSRVERVERVEENGRVEHKEHKELGEPWPKAKLGEVCEIISGVSYSKGDIASEGIRILRGGNLKEDHNLYLSDDDVFLPEQYASEKNTVRKNDIVVVNSTGSLAVIGRAAIARKDYPKTQIGAFLRIIRPLVSDYAPWIAYIFCSPFYQRHIQDMCQGASIKNLKSSCFSDFEIPLPPLAVQRLIVSRLEAAAGRRARIVALAAEGAAAAADLRRAILKEAFE